MLHLLSKSGQPASKLFQAFEVRAQKLVNLEGIDPAVLKQPPVVDALAAIEARIAGSARILVRPSGTQSLIRVMVEADDEVLLDEVMQEIILLIKDHAKKSQ